jgi:hypothetical protein
MIRSKSRKLCLMVVGGMMLAGTAEAAPVGTAFTYQGSLKRGGAAANGAYDFRFGLLDAATGGTQIGAAVTNAAVTVSNGLFTVVLDFGTNAFDGSARWLEVSVRQGANDFTVLSPRQPLTPTPYAITATTVANPVGVFGGTFTGSFVGDGSALTNLSTTAVTAATNALWSSTTNWIDAQGYHTTNSASRSAIASPVPFGGTNFVVDFASEVAQVSATNDINIAQSTNRPADGWYAESVWYILGGTTNYTLRVNSDWTSIGILATNVPYVLQSNKLTILALAARGSNETNVTYAIGRQE